MDQLRQLSRFLACGLLCLLSGCCANCGQLLCDGCADIPPGAIPQPTGAHVCGWQAAQDALAEKDDFIIYQYEWKGESTELGPFGRRHIAGLLQRLEAEPHSIVVESSDIPLLDTQRQTSLIEILVTHGVADAQSRVRVGYAAAEGLHGQEAPQLEQGYFRSGLQRGGFGGGFGGAGGFGTGSVGGGGFGSGGLY